VPDWPVYVALGDSLTAGRDDPGPGGGRIGWARRLAGLLTTRTSVPCTLTNLATDGAGVAAVLERQLPAVAGIGPEQAAGRGELCLDTWAMPGASDPGLFGPDRIHPNAAGHQLMAAAFADLLLAPGG
jgi:lysophospholipase L1-like esterase